MASAPFYVLPVEGNDPYGLICTPLHPEYAGTHVHARVHASLEDVSISVNIVDHIAHVTICQKYTYYPGHMSWDCSLVSSEALLPAADAEYTFPIPANAAVHGFSFTRGDGTKVVGGVRETAEAREEFVAAVNEGRPLG